jgi:hypothetical protein
MLLAQITLTVILRHLEQNFFGGATQSQKNRSNITQFSITVHQLVCAVLSDLHYTTQIKFKIFNMQTYPKASFSKHMQELLVFSGQRGGFLPGTLLTLNTLWKVNHQAQEFFLTSVNKSTI